MIEKLRSFAYAANNDSSGSPETSLTFLHIPFKKNPPNTMLPGWSAGHELHMPHDSQVDDPDYIEEDDGVQQKYFFIENKIYLVSIIRENYGEGPIAEMRIIMQSSHAVSETAWDLFRKDIKRREIINDSIEMGLDIPLPKGWEYMSPDVLEKHFDEAAAAKRSANQARALEDAAQRELEKKRADTAALEFLNTTYDDLIRDYPICLAHHSRSRKRDYGTKLIFCSNEFEYRLVQNLLYIPSLKSSITRHTATNRFSFNPKKDAYSFATIRTMASQIVSWLTIANTRNSFPISTDILNEISDALTSGTALTEEQRATILHLQQSAI